MLLKLSTAPFIALGSYEWTTLLLSMDCKHNSRKNISLYKQQCIIFWKIIFFANITANWFELTKILTLPEMLSAVLYIAITGA